MQPSVNHSAWICQALLHTLFDIMKYPTLPSSSFEYQEYDYPKLLRLTLKKKKTPRIWRIFLQLGNSRPKHVFVMFPEFSLQ